MSPYDGMVKSNTIVPKMLSMINTHFTHFLILAIDLSLLHFSLVRARTLTVEWQKERRGKKLIHTYT